MFNFEIHFLLISFCYIGVKELKFGRVIIFMESNSNCPHGSIKGFFKICVGMFNNCRTYIGL
jgi:hypothetical protein